MISRLKELNALLGVSFNGTTTNITGVPNIGVVKKDDRISILKGAILASPSSEKFNKPIFPPRKNKLNKGELVIIKKFIYEHHPEKNFDGFLKAEVVKLRPEHLPNCTPINSDMNLPLCFSQNTCSKLLSGEILDLKIQSDKVIIKISTYLEFWGISFEETIRGAKTKPAWLSIKRSFNEKHEADAILTWSGKPSSQAKAEGMLIVKNSIAKSANIIPSLHNETPILLHNETPILLNHQGELINELYDLLPGKS